MNDAANVLQLTFWIVWPVLAVYLAVRTRVGAPATLRAAPVRESKLSLVAVGLVLLLYLFCAATVLAVAGAFGVKAGESPKAPIAAGVERVPVTTASAPATSQAAPATAAATSPATNPATAAMTATPTASQPAMGPTTADAATSAARAPDSRPAPTAEERDSQFAIQCVDGISRLMMFGIVLAVVPWLFREGFRGIGLHYSQLIPGIAKGSLGFVIIFPVLMVIGLIQSMLLERYHVQQETHVILQAIEAQSVPTYQLIGYVIIAVVVAPLAEELVFRGLLQTAVLQRGFGFLIPQFAPPSAEAKGWVPTVRHRWVAIIVSSLLFTGVHMPYVMTAPIILPLALALGYLYERTGNLYAVIVLHALFNSVNLWMSRME